MMHITKSKDGRWDYQKFFVHTTHLGDIIVCTNIIYNFAMQNKFVAMVKYSKPEVGKSLNRIFDYEGKLRFENFLGRQGHSFAFADFVHIKRSESGHWCFQRFASMTTRAKKLSGFKLPRCRLKPYNSDRKYQTCQFNSYSSSWFKRQYENREVDAAIKMFGRGNTFYVGKPGTKTYTAGMKTHYANLEEQASFMLGCDSFFGVDSGMSHLAGSLGVKGDVCIQTQDSRLIGCVTAMYNLMYPSLKLHRRTALQDHLGHDKTLL